MLFRLKHTGNTPPPHVEHGKPASLSRQSKRGGSRERRMIWERFEFHSLHKVGKVQVSDVSYQLPTIL